MEVLERVSVIFIPRNLLEHSERGGDLCGAVTSSIDMGSGR